MLYIIAPTTIRASHAAAAMGLPPQDWKSVTGTQQLRGLRGIDVLSLPGADREVAQYARSIAGNYAHWEL